MAATTLLRRELHDVLGDVAGYKAGLALSREELLRHLCDFVVLRGALNAPVRIRLEEFDDLARNLLYRIGVLASKPGRGPAIEMYAKYHTDPAALKILSVIQESFWECSVRGGVGPIDITPVAERAVSEFGSSGLVMFREYEAAIQEHLHGSFNSGLRRFEWQDKAELAALFAQACITPSNGTFLDQRYIDYLERNRESLDSMHWRNFEAFTAEFFSRTGYAVELGAGQGDGGIDLRAWEPDTKGGAPTILIQCKRQASKVGQVVVKALWADVQAENAQSGLIVTTSALQPGAARVASARLYNIKEADRNKVEQWLVALRSPGSGMVVA